MGKSMQVVVEVLNSSLEIRNLHYNYSLNNTMYTEIFLFISYFDCTESPQTEPVNLTIAHSTTTNVILSKLL